MTPQEKAKELIEHFAETIKPIYFDSLVERDWKGAKACALICVEEILKVNKDAWSRIPDIGLFDDYIPYRYWLSVKKSIKEEGQ